MNTDAVELPELTRRQEEVLSLIIKTYTESPDPVSSKYLYETFQLNFSTATIRNEMAVLEEKGYIRAPHTSAGRIPTEDGYRYFVRRLLTISDLTTSEQTDITHKLQTLPLATEQWMRLAATVMARTAQSAALVTPPIAETNRFKHVELISIQGRLVLMVLVLNTGSVLQQMLNLAEPVAQNVLSEAAQRINNLCLDLTANEVRMKGVQLHLLERDMAELAADLVERADANQVRFIYRDGLSEIINMFQGNEGAQQVVRIFEERAFLNMIVSEVLSVRENQVQVLIAGDGRWEELKHLSIVLSRYGIPGQVTGAVGVIGPTHINYGRAVSTVRFVSNQMTGMLADLYALPDQQRNTAPNDKVNKASDT
ncbi:MAG: heat-inducible transcriptional repressor HrcA [Anaerolineae bacterium]|nr:heat-inducible transcriptional repressor HrcA [Anaerolineae bacterium]